MECRDESFQKVNSFVVSCVTQVWGYRERVPSAVRSQAGSVRFARRTLSLRGNALEDLASLDHYPALESLLISGNMITDPLVLAGRESITVVELHGNPIDKDKCPRTKKTVKAKGLRTACSSIFPKE